MMRCFVCVAFLAAAGSSASTSIVSVITAGTADVVSLGQGATSQLASFSLSGPDFSFTGTGTEINPVFLCDNPIVPNRITNCATGQHINPSAGDITFGPMTGAISFQDNSENYGPNVVAQVYATLDLTTPTSIAPNTLPSVAVSGPFRGVAVFIDPNFEGGAMLNFFGQGTATAHLIGHHVVEPSGEDFGSFFVLQSIHLDFATPEPGTSTLVGMALACCAITRLGRPRKRG
jgi:hypothetical protein